MPSLRFGRQTGQRELISVAPGSTGEVILAPNTHLFIHACDHGGNSFKKSNSPPQSSQGGEAGSAATENDEAQEKREIVEGENFKFAYCPNPFRNYLYVDVLPSKSSHLKIELFNIFGQRMNVLSDQNVTGKMEQDFLYDGNKLPAGIYLLRVTAGEERFTKKILKTE